MELFVGMFGLAVNKFSAGLLNGRGALQTNHAAVDLLRKCCNHVL
jgi:hypothetical protein